MQIRALLTTALTAGATVLAGVATAPPAVASGEEWGLNGTYIATSNGEWSRTNEVFRNEASIRSTWTISTQCSYPTECTGTVTSDWGWTAPIYKKSGVWYVKRTVPQWEPCPDGSAADGLQVYRFWPTGPDFMIDPTSTTLTGEDATTAPSGACGISKPLHINMPFKLVKAG